MLVPSLITGPAIVTFDSYAWYSEGDISVKITQGDWTPQSSRYGNLAPRTASIPVARVSFKPDGQVTSTRLGKAYPYTFADIGKSIFTDTDKPLTIQTLAGQLHTFNRAGVVGVPGLNLSAQATLFDGTIELACCVGRGLKPATANTFYKVEASAFADTTFDETKILSPGYSAAWGTTPYDVIEAVNGFKLSYGISVQEKKVDRLGVVDMILTGIGPAVCRFAPANLTDAQWATLVHLDGADAILPGADRGSGSKDLVITGTGLTVTMPKANLGDPELNFGISAERYGDLSFYNRLVSTNGVPAALISFTVA